MHNYHGCGAGMGAQVPPPPLLEVEDFAASQVSLCTDDWRSHSKLIAEDDSIDIGVEGEKSLAKKWV